MTSVGEQDLILGNVGVSNPLAAPFSITANTCNGATLVPTTGSCVIDVTFTPTAGGILLDSFDIPSNDPRGVATIWVRGTGETGRIAVSPLNFGQVQINNSATGTVTITNSSATYDLVLGAVAGVNGVAAPFAMTNNPCDGLTLPPLGTCTVTFSFSPTAGGAYTDTFDVTSNDHTRASITGRLDGSGFDRTISLAPSPVDFGNVPLNQSSSMWLVVTNNGTTSLTIGTVAGVDPLAAPFSILSDNCSNSTVVAGGNCSIQLLFIPTVTGLLTDTFDIPSNDPATPSYNVSVSGTGATGSLSIGPANMGSATIGTTVTKAVVVNNIGGVNLTIGTIGVSDPLGAPFSLIGNTCNGATLAPATTCELTLEFSPTVAGAASDTFDIQATIHPTQSPLLLYLETDSRPVEVVVEAEAEKKRLAQVRPLDGSTIRHMGPPMLRWTPLLSGWKILATKGALLAILLSSATTPTFPPVTRSILHARRIKDLLWPG